MDHPLIHDRGRGPEIVGTRVTVYNLFTDFLDATKTETQIGRLYDLSPEQVTAARAYILNNLDTVVAEHLRIETRNAAGNPPEVLETLRKAGTPLMEYKSWLDRQRSTIASEQGDGSGPGDDHSRAARFPSFREWLAERDARPATGS